mgnify:CR=1 FL=1
MNNTIVWGFAQIIPPIYFLVVGMFLWFVQVLEASFDEKTIMILASILATIGGMGFYLWEYSRNPKHFDWKMLVINGLVGFIVGLITGLFTYEYLVKNYGVYVWLGTSFAAGFIKDVVILVARRLAYKKSEVFTDEEIKEIENTK